MRRSCPGVVKSLIPVLSTVLVACSDAGTEAGGAGGMGHDAPERSSAPASVSGSATTGSATTGSATTGSATTGSSTTGSATTGSSTTGASTTSSSTASGSGPDLWIPALETSWHWLLSHPLDLNDPKDMGLVDPTGAPLDTPPPTVYDLDWEHTPAETVAALHARGARVICYVDVGAFEDYRSDAGGFPESVKGNPDHHWEGSFWLDIRQIDVLGPIMQARFQVCKDKGFDAIEPDEVDGYANDTGFPLTYEDQIAYNRFIADLAHSMGMSVGLKGNVEQAEDLWPYFDWTLNEQCFEYDECEILFDTFVANGKAVFHVEYDDPYSGHMTDRSLFCEQANAWNFNSMEMPLYLDGGRWPCR